MKLISIVTPCYNEEDNVEELYQRVKDTMASKLIKYRYEHIFIDNASTDSTVEKLKKIALIFLSTKALFKRLANLDFDIFSSSAFLI